MRTSASGIQTALAGDSIGGELVGGPAKRAATFGAGRVCEEEGCTTRLSMYNSRTKCAAHDFDPSLMNFRCPTHPEHNGHAATRAAQLVEAAELVEPAELAGRRASRPKSRSAGRPAATRRHGTPHAPRHAA